MVSLSLKEVPFGLLVGISLVISLLHAVLERWWSAIRYTSFGPRPPSAEVFIGSEVLLLMLVFTIGMIHVSGQDSGKPIWGYYLGIAATIAAWIVASFAL